MTVVPPEGRSRPAISPQQQALNFARRVIAEFRSTGTYSGPQVQLPVRPLFNLDEIRIARAPFRHLTFTGIGDGTVPDAGLLAAGSVASGSTAVMVGSIAGMMIGRSRARKAAIPRWHEIAPGELIITNYGLYVLKPGDPPFVVAWEDALSARMTAWDAVEIDAEDGKDALITPAATLIFGLWCLAVYPQHPQLQTLF